MTRRDFLSTGALLGASLSVLPGSALAKDDVVSTTAAASDGGAGGTAAAFRRLHAAYQDLLRWADHPTFIRRRGFPDKWYYDGDNKKWVQPVPVRKG